MKFLLFAVLILAFGLIGSASAASMYKDIGVGIKIAKPLIDSGKLRYSDIIPIDNATAYYGPFVRHGSDVQRVTIPQHNNIGPMQFSSKFYVMVDPPSALQNRLPLITIVSNLDSFHTKDQMKTNEFKYTKEEKARSIIISSHTMRWVDERCREAKISYSNWQVLLPDTIAYLKSGCDPKYTKISTIVNQTKILTKHDIATSSKYKLDAYYDYIKQNCIKSRNSCTDIINKAVATSGSSK